jgi:hypothetical protein
LTCEEIYSDIENDDDFEYDDIECDSSHTKIMGDWVKDENGLYMPYEKGEFAAIVNESTIQVVWSKYTTHGRLCSPCYPGQLDVRMDDNSGEYIGYTLPEYLIYKSD